MVRVKGSLVRAVAVRGAAPSRRTQCPACVLSRI